jgi:hypothetical protein
MNLMQLGALHEKKVQRVLWATQHLLEDGGKSRKNLIELED